MFLAGISIWVCFKNLQFCDIQNPISSEKDGFIVGFGFVSFDSIKWCFSLTSSGFVVSLVGLLSRGSRFSGGDCERGLLDSDKVEEREEDCKVLVDVDGDLMMSRRFLRAWIGFQEGSDELRQNEHL